MDPRAQLAAHAALEDTGRRARRTWSHVCGAECPRPCPERGRPDPYTLPLPGVWP